MKPSDIFFRLMEAATERGIEQIKGEYSQGGFYNPSGVCVRGLYSWGLRAGITTEMEKIALRSALPIRSAILNDGGWTFPDFYEYLKDKEAKQTETKTDTPVAQLAL